MPDDRFERRAAARMSGPVCGVDEAGRGPLAGPVIAAAVILDLRNIPAGLDDSKKLSERAREKAFAALQDGGCIAGIGEASVDEIDLLNIRQATHLAMARAVRSLAVPAALALVDGNDAPALPCPCATLVGGDGLSLSIAAASIIAKVTRDALMRALHHEHPAYGWDRNKGYGTKDHLLALARDGASPHHRRSFAPVHNILYGDKPVDSTLTL
jgi:ribonuclease HII